ncbi:DUF4411 family protein [bacterium]|nr:DUF4411 family protein [bacterium]
MKYIIDASSLITSMKITYPPEVFDSLWDKVSKAMDDGHLISCEAVLLELDKGDDVVSKWAKKRKKYFMAVTSAEAVKVSEILEKFPKLVDASLGTESADPYLIAKAFIGGVDKYKVVTEESQTKLNKIPAVGRSFGVVSINFISMVKEMGWKF